MRLVTNSDTRSAILLPSSPPVTHPSSSILAVIDAKQTWAHHRHYNRHQRQMRFKFDYSQLFRNMHFIFIFNFVFIFIFSIFCIRNAQFQFQSEFLIPCHSSFPHSLWLCDFSCSVSVSVWFRFFLCLCFFLFFIGSLEWILCWLSRSLLGTVAFVWLKLISRFSLGIWDST